MCCVLTQLKFLFSKFPYMMYTYPTQTTFIYLFFPSLFSPPSISSPFPSKFFSFPPLTILSLLHPRDSSSSSPKRQEERNILYKKKKKWEKTKKPAAIVGLWVYVRIEHYTFDLEFCSVFGWLEVGGKKKKEEPLLLAQCDFSFGLLAIDKEGA